MRLGKLEENIVKRAVIRQISGAALPAGTVPAGGPDGRWASAGDAPEDGVVTACITQLPGYEETPSMWAVAAANRLWSKGAVPEGLAIHALLPPQTQEQWLKQRMREAAQAAQDNGMRILDGQSQVTDAVNAPVFTVTAFGHRGAGEAEIPVRPAAPGDSLVMTKWTALAGTAALARRRMEALQQVLPQELVQTAASFDALCPVAREVRCISACLQARGGDGAFFYDLSQGGIFGALRLICERFGLGLEADLRAIPIRQETIEVCEQSDLNPYTLYSAGALLVATTDAKAVLDALLQAGIPAVQIGRLTGRRERILRNGADIRYLDRIPQDAWYSLTNT